MKRLGFMFEETMTGTFTRTGKPDQGGALRVNLRARSEDVRKYWKDRLVAVEGTIDMEHLADDVPVTGTIEISPFKKKIIRYELDFTGDDGRPYRYLGQKDIRFSDLVGTWTTCNGAIVDAKGEEIARGTVRFDLKDLAPFVASWRPALHG